MRALMLPFPAATGKIYPRRMMACPPLSCASVQGPSHPTPLPSSSPSMPYPSVPCRIGRGHACPVQQQLKISFHEVCTSQMRQLKGWWAQLHALIACILLSVMAHEHPSYHAPVRQGGAGCSLEHHSANSAQRSSARTCQLAAGPRHSGFLLCASQLLGRVPP